MLVVKSRQSNSSILRSMGAFCLMVPETAVNLPFIWLQGFDLSCATASGAPTVRRPTWFPAVFP
jgi:hypothetical protein